MLRIGFLLPSVQFDALTQWVLTFCKYVDRSKIQLCGTALCQWSKEDQLLVNNLAQYMTVYGPPVANDAPDNAHNNVVRSEPDASTGISIVASQSDIILTWVPQSLHTMLSFYKAAGTKIGLISNSTVPGSLGESAGVADFRIATSRAATLAFSRDDVDASIILPLGVDVDRCLPKLSGTAARKALGIAPGVKVIGSYGSASVDKNPTTLALAVQAMPDHHLVFAGRYAQRLQPLLSRMLPDRHSIITGHFHPGDVMQTFNVAVDCGHCSGFSLSVAELATAGVPVASSNWTDMGVAYRYGMCPVPTVDELRTAINNVFAGVGHPEEARKHALRELNGLAVTQRWTDKLLSL